MWCTSGPTSCPKNSWMKNCFCFPSRPVQSHQKGTSQRMAPPVSGLIPFPTRVLFLASEYISKQVRVVPSINRPTRVNPSIFWRLKKEPCSLPMPCYLCPAYMYLVKSMNHLWRGHAQLPYILHNLESSQTEDFLLLFHLCWNTSAETPFAIQVVLWSMGVWMSKV
jgi:hypothetical protein